MPEANHEVLCVYPDGAQAKSVACGSAIPGIVSMHKAHKLFCSLYVDGVCVHEGVSKPTKSEENA